MSSEQASKKNWGVAAIVIAFILIAGWVMLGPTASKNSSDFSTESQYSSELKRITDKFSRCIANTELAPSRQTDPMEGTNLSRENIAQSTRDDCQRQYDTQKRILENKY